MSYTNCTGIIDGQSRRPVRRRKTVPKIPPVPTVEQAIANSIVVRNANDSMLAQTPYTGYEPGFGWWLDSVATGGRLPSNARHVYNISVLPEGYFR